MTNNEKINRIDESFYLYSALILFVSMLSQITLIIVTNGFFGQAIGGMLSLTASTINYYHHSKKRKKLTDGIEH